MSNADCIGPEIEGRDNFRGTLVHTADWDISIDWHDKRVAVIGSGASGVQVVPQLVNGTRAYLYFIHRPTHGYLDHPHGYNLFADTSILRR